MNSCDVINVDITVIIYLAPLQSPNLASIIYFVLSSKLLFKVLSSLKYILL